VLRCSCSCVMRGVVRRLMRLTELSSSTSDVLWGDLTSLQKPNA
jgi:hypothetical protein